MTEPLTPEQQADARTHDVMAFAYTDTDGKLYTVNQSGERVEAPAGTPALSPEYQAVAERTAALVISYNKIINLTPQERGILADLASGRRQVDETLSAGVREAWEGLRGAADQSGIVPNVPGAGLITGAAGAISGVADGFTFIPNLLRDITNAGGDIINQLGGGIISRENAIAIGTAYASARQAAAAGRPTEVGVSEFLQGLFSRHFLSYASAGFSWVMGMVGLGESKTLAQHLEASSRDDDNVSVAEEMAELNSIGGQNATEVATLLTTGGTVRDSAGNETNVAPADSDNAAPAGPAGADAPATPDEALALAEQNQKGVVELVTTAAQNADFTGTNAALAGAGLGGLALGVAGNGQVLRGAAEGIARQHVNRPAATAARLQGKADGILDTITNPNAERTSRFQFWRKTPEQLAALTEQHETLEARAARATATAEARAAAAGNFTRTAQAELSGGNIFSKLWNVPRHIGRGIGDMVGFTGYHTAEAGKGVFHRLTGGIFASTPDVPDAPEATRTAPATGNAGRAAHAAAEVAETAAEAAPAAARSAGWLGRITSSLSNIRGGGRVGSLLRLAGIGAAGIAGTTVATSAMANTGTSTDNNRTDNRTDENDDRDVVRDAAVAGSAGTMVGLARLGGTRAFGTAGTVFAVANDGFGVAEGIQRRDGHQVARSSGRVAGGVAGGLGGAAAGAAAGAAIGVWFGGVGAVPGALLGGGLGLLGSAVGGWLGASAGGEVVDYVAGDAVQNLAFGAPTPAPRPAAPTQTVRLALTPEEALAGHDTVRTQARMAMRPAGGGEVRFNPAAFASVSTTRAAVANPPAGNNTNGGRSQTVHFSV